MSNEAMDRVTVIAVLAEDQDRKALREIFTHFNWELRFAPSIEAGTQTLMKTSAGIFIVGEELPERCSWRDALDSTEQMPRRPLLIVASRLADERLWAEALNVGAYDVLATPFQPPEVYRVVSFAWQTWRRFRQVARSNGTELATAAGD
jgi:DNA-binding NtrC family response regulator